MRPIGLLLATSLLLGCGSGHGGDPGFHARTGFQAPSISQLAPNSVPVNSPSFTMTISGANFGTDAVLFWNGNPQTVFFVSSSQLTTIVTDTELSFAGFAHVFVRTAGMNSNTVDFNVAPE